MVLVYSLTTIVRRLHCRLIIQSGRTPSHYAIGQKVIPGAWRVRSCVLLLCLGVMSSCSPASPQPSAVDGKADGHFVGSAACQSCHGEIYDRWKDTLMANVIRDPRQHPSAVLGDFSTPNPLVTYFPPCRAPRCPRVRWPGRGSSCSRPGSARRGLQLDRRHR